MQAMATTLNELEPAARARVFHWLQERFQVDSTPAAAQPRAAAPVSLSPLSLVPPPVAAADERLAVGALEDFFSPRDVQAAPPQGAPQTVTGLLTEFVAEFQNMAREWDDACALPAEPSRLLSAAS